MPYQTALSRKAIKTNETSLDVQIRCVSLRPIPKRAINIKLAEPRAIEPA